MKLSKFKPLLLSGFLATGISLAFLPVAYADSAASIDFGDDSSPWANDDECDDNRFEGTGMASSVSEHYRFQDASDCEAAFDLGKVTLIDGEPATQADVAPSPTPASGSFDFGDNTSNYANDGECDDPRFEGPGTDAILLDSDLGRDAADCEALFNSGEVTIIDDAQQQPRPAVPVGDIDFGNNTSDYADDGECDDPRFAGPGTASILLEGDRARDANDCETLFAEGEIWLKGEAVRPDNASSLTASEIEFGDDTGDTSHDNECDDPRFVGPNVWSGASDEERYHDASDCEASVIAETAFLRDDAEATIPRANVDIDDIDFGDDEGEWANDVECDDPRFIGSDSADVLVEADRFHDATDCREAMENGTVELKAGEPLTSGDLPAMAGTDLSLNTGRPDFGDDAHRWANDGECDDRRFYGPAMAAPTWSGDAVGHDATDCREGWNNDRLKWRTEQVLGIEGIGSIHQGINFGDDSSEFAMDGECDDSRFAGDSASGLDQDRKDRTDCLVAFINGDVHIE